MYGGSLFFLDVSPSQVAGELALQLVRQKVKSNKARVLDLCCGVGTSTRALRDAFPEAETVIGMDTSLEMIYMANFLSKHLNFVKPLFQTLRYYKKRMTKEILSAATFARGNAECTDLPDKSFDLVTIMYAFHEVPSEGRDRMIREARRLLQPGGTLAIIDIHADFQPSQSMLLGEPYGKHYTRHVLLAHVINQSINYDLSRFVSLTYTSNYSCIPNLQFWNIKRTFTNSWKNFKDSDLPSIQI
jgi:ubiquinone/menaquinone biosynthesis C-methylase UbiE